MELSEVAARLPLEVWRGAARAWQCDEMRHLNASFYIANADEGLAAIAAALGVYPDTDWRPVCHHIRFASEVAAGTALHMRAGILSASETRLRVLQVLVNTDTGGPCACIMTDVENHAGANGGAFNQATLSAAKALLVSAPNAAFAVAIPDSAPHPTPDFATAETLGLVQTALGCFLPVEGRRATGDVMTDAFIGRIADATRYFSRLFEKTARAYDDNHPHLGTAALECRLDYLSWPKVGDRFCIQSGFAEIGAKSSRRVIHWMFDADSRRPLCAVRTLEVNFDLVARRTRTVHPAVRATLQKYIVEGLRP